MRNMHAWGDIAAIVRLGRRVNTPDRLKRYGWDRGLSLRRWKMFRFTFLQIYRRARLAARRPTTPERCNMQAALLPFILR